MAGWATLAVLAVAVGLPVSGLAASQTPSRSLSSTSPSGDEAASALISTQILSPGVKVDPRVRSDPRIFLDVFLGRRLSFSVSVQAHQRSIAAVAGWVSGYPWGSREPIAPYLSLGGQVGWSGQPSQVLLMGGVRVHLPFATGISLLVEGAMPLVWPDLERRSVSAQTGLALRF